MVSLKLTSCSLRIFKYIAINKNCLGFHVECEDTRNLKYRLVSREARTGNLTSDVHQNNPKVLTVRPRKLWNRNMTIIDSS